MQFVHITVVARLEVHAFMCNCCDQVAEAVCYEILSSQLVLRELRFRSGSTSVGSVGFLMRSSSHHDGPCVRSHEAASG